MFVGKSEHSLDPKGRLVLPAKYRDQLADGGYVVEGIDGCLAIYTTEEFQTVATDMEAKARRGALERNVARSFAAGAEEINPDKQGRVALPAGLREYAGLDERVVIIGALNRLEVWDSAKWAELQAEARRHLSDATPGLEDMGI